MNGNEFGNALIDAIEARLSRKGEMTVTFIAAAICLEHTLYLFRPLFTLERADY